LLKNCENRLLRARLRKALTVFTDTYRATTAREWNDFEFFNKLLVKILGPTKVELDGRILTSFAGTNYLGLSFHPRVLETLIAAASRSGLGMGASRKTSGTTDEVLELERRAAQFTGAEAAIVTTSGTLANIGVLDGLNGEIDHWLVDERAHLSFSRFLAISSAAIHTYRHADPADLAQKRAGLDGRVGIYTDAVFPMTGEVAPLAAIASASRNALLVFDEAHSLGTMGQCGRGLATPGAQTIVTGTLSKALGCSGGLILGSAEKIALIRDRSGVLAATGALSPALAAAATTAFDVLDQDPERFARLRANIALMRELTREHLGLAPDQAHDHEAAPIFYKSESAAQCSALAREAGYLVPLVSAYPGAPHEAMIRWIVSSEHTGQDIWNVARILTRL
jgi:7-keto-8-aminopelargonate synthetase-like enzyme